MSREADVTEDAKNTTKTFTLTCKSKEKGTIVFKVTGDICDENGIVKDVNELRNIKVTSDSNVSNSFGIFAIVIVVFIVVFSGIGIGVYVKKKAK